MKCPWITISRLYSIQWEYAAQLGCGIWPTAHSLLKTTPCSNSSSRDKEKQIEEEIKILPYVCTYRDCCTMYNRFRLESQRARFESWFELLYDKTVLRPLAVCSNLRIKLSLSWLERMQWHTRMSGFCFPEIYSYTITSAPNVTGSVLMRRFRLFLEQCRENKISILIHLRVVERSYFQPKADGWQPVEVVSNQKALCQ